MKSLFVLALMTFSAHSWGAACCGGNIASPALISGDEKAIFTLSLSQGEIAEFVDREGLSRSHALSRDRTALISGATIFSDRWQLGAMTTLKQQEQVDQAEDATRLGDTSVLIGYEAWPEWVYHPYQPHTYVFVQITAPTGVSRYDSTKTGGVDVSGNGFWNLGAGLLMTKIWNQWDAQLQAELHQGFQREFNSPTLGRIRVEPGWGRSLYTNLGYNIEDWRMGAGLRYTQEDPATTSGDITSKSAEKKWTSLILTANKVLNEKWAAALTYTDDTLLGNPTNTFLSKTLTATIQRRWNR